MERITPIELERAKLRKSALGYRPDEVQTLLNRAAETLSALLAENDALRRDHDRLRGEVAQYQGQEDLLKQTLLLAQRTADETRAAAHATALAERAEIERQIQEAKFQLERVRIERDRFVEDLRMVVTRMARELEPAPGLAVVSGPEASVANA